MRVSEIRKTQGRDEIRVEQEEGGTSEENLVKGKECSGFHM